jgi:hypothetical protein
MGHLGALHCVALHCICSDTIILLSVYVVLLFCPSAAIICARMAILFFLVANVSLVVGCDNAEVVRTLLTS